MLCIVVTQLKTSTFSSESHYVECQKSMFEDVQESMASSFAASILEDVFIDDFTEQRYLCTGAIITTRWVMTNSKCVQKESQPFKTRNYLVRAGTNSWARGGYLREVTKILLADQTMPSTVAALELKTAFGSSKLTKPITLTKEPLYQNYGIATMLAWKSNDSMPFYLRKKFIRLTLEPIVMFHNERCEEKSLSQRQIFCASVINSHINMCDYYTGFPIVRANHLIGVEIGQFCDKKLNVSLHLIYNVTFLLNWLENVTGISLM